MLIVGNISHANNQTHGPAHFLTIPSAVHYFSCGFVPVLVMNGRPQFPETCEPAVAEIKGYVDHDLPDLARPGLVAGGI